MLNYSKMNISLGILNAVIVISFLVVHLATLRGLTWRGIGIKEHLMSRIQTTYRIAKRLMDGGMEPKEALEEAKRIVAKHPTADQIRAMRAIRMRFLAVAIVVWALMLVVAFKATAAEDWDTTDKVLFGSFLVAQTLDTLQTVDSYSHANLREINPCINWAHDQMGSAGVVLYLTASTVLIYWLADNMVPKWRKVFVSGMLSFKVISVGSNFANGAELGIKF